MIKELLKSLLRFPLVTLDKIGSLIKQVLFFMPLAVIKFLKKWPWDGIQVNIEKRKFFKWAVICIFILVGGYYGVNRMIMPKIYLSKAVNLLKEGEYIKARLEMEKMGVRNSNIKNLLNILNTPLTFNIDLRYLNERHQPPDENLLKIPSAGNYRLEFVSSSKSYLYIYQLDFHNNLKKLFPNLKYSPVLNPIFAHKIHYLPSTEFENQKGWFILDENIGEEKIYFVASFWPSLDLEKLFDQFKKSTTEQEKDSLRSQLIERLERREQVQSFGIKGVFYKVFPFMHEKRQKKVGTYKDYLSKKEWQHIGYGRFGYTYQQAQSFSMENGGKWSLPSIADLQALERQKASHIDKFRELSEDHAYWTKDRATNGNPYGYWVGKTDNGNTIEDYPESWALSVILVRDIKK